jgi:hypothetical protein
MYKNLQKCAFFCLLSIVATNLSAQYCVSGGPTSTADSNTESVDLAGDAATAIAYTGCSAGGLTGVEDLTATQIVNVTAGNSYTADVQFGTCSGNYAGAGEAWIDWNQNEIFEASESIGTWTGTPPTTLSSFAFTVPANAVNDTTRMRVIQEEGATLPLNPCQIFTYGSVVDFTVVVSGGLTITCATPNALTATNISASTADLGWTENGSASSWEIEYGLNGFTQGAGTVSVVGTNPFSLTGLTATTAYSFYVRSICGVGDTSSWSGPVSFSTPCNAIVAPWTEPFTGTIPSCWNQGASNGESWLFGTTGGHVGNVGTPGGATTSGGNFAWVDDSGNHNTGTTLESPLVDVSGLTTPALRFYLIKNNEGYTNVDFSVDVWDGAAWNTGFYTNNGNTANGEWEEIILSLGSLTITGPVQLRFIVDENNGTDYYDDAAIDDVSLIEAPSCLAPSMLAATTLSPTTANLAWMDNAGASSWEIEYGINGFAQGTGTSVFTATNPHNLSGLTPNTSYDFYVRAICGPGDTSSWAGPATFITPCLAITAPWTEPFTGTIPSCWNQGASNGESWLFGTTGGHVGNAGTLGGATTSGANFAWVDDSGGHNTGTTLESPFVDVSGLTTPALRFYLIKNNEGFTNVDFSVDVWDGAAWNTGFYTNTGNTASGEWEEIILSLGSLTITGPVQLRFIVDENNGTDYYDDAAIDDVSLIEMPSCPTPSALVVSSITSTSADLGWTENGTATSWQVEYGVNGFTQGTGTAIITGSNPLAVSGLSTASQYDFYVRAVCGAGDTSNWVGPNTFITLFNSPLGVNCVSGGAASFLFSDDMETAIGWTGDIGTANVQWDFPTAAPGGNSTNTGPSAAQSGTTYAEFEASGIVADTASMVTPMIDLSSGADDAELSFYMHAFGADIGKLNVGVSTSPTGPFTNEFSWTGQYQTAANDAWAHIGVNLSAYLGQQIYIEFSYAALTSGFEGDMAIDLVQVETCVSCPTPSALTASNLTATSVELGWSQAGSAASWDVEYGLAGFTQGAGTTVNTTVNPLNLSGLTPNTSYEFYVIARCSPTDSSLWAGPYSFTTDCLPITGDSLTDPIIIPSFPFADTNSTLSCYTDTRDNPSADVFYQMIIPACFDSVLVSLCGSSYDTYLRVLDASGTEIAFNDDGCGPQSQLTLTGVTSGDTLYIVVEGFGSDNGNYVLDISGVSVGNVSVTGTITDVSCNGLSDGGIDITVIGGTAPYTYVWSTGDTIADLTGIGANSYNLVSVTDSNGCSTGGLSYIVNEPTVLSVIITDNGNGTATAAASGGTSPYTYSWSNGDTSATTTVITSGIQVVSVIDTNGCIITDSISIVIASLSNNNSNNVTVNVSPNPNSGVFTLNLNTTNVTELNIQVMNAQGQTVYAKNNFENITNVSEQIDLSNNAKGIYFINITSDKGVKTHKVIVQ